MMTVQGMMLSLKWVKVWVNGMSGSQASTVPNAFAYCPAVCRTGSPVMMGHSGRE